MSEPLVLLRRSSLGDVVLVGAVTAAARVPCVVVTAPEWVAVAQRLRGVVEVIPWPKAESVATLAERIPPGRVVDLQGSGRSRALVRAIGRGATTIDKRSLRRRMRLWWGRGPVRPDVPSLYAEAAGVGPHRGATIDLSRTDPQTLVLVPGAAWATKQWPAGRMAHLAQEWSGPVAVLGGPGEEALCAQVAAGRPDAQVECERGFESSFSVLSRAAVVVSGDTGLMHLAAACGVPVVSIFGPTHPDDGFWAHRGEVVQRALSCRPCSLHGQERCPRGHHRCMDIQPDAVMRAVRRVSP